MRARNALTSRLPLLLALGSLASGCAAGGIPDAVAEAENIEVAYFEFDTGNPAILIASEGHPRYSSVRDEPRRPDQVNVKLAPRDLVEEVIAFAADQGFFEYAENLRGPEDVDTTLVKKMIVIRGDASSYAMTFQQPVTDAAAGQAFSTISFELARVFRDIPSYQMLDLGDDAETFFTEQQRRLQEHNQRAKTGGGSR